MTEQKPPPFPVIFRVSDRRFTAYEKYRVILSLEALNYCL